MALTEDIKQNLLRMGADLVGIASVDRFVGAPERLHPEMLLPGVKSVIVIAVRILKAVQIPQRRLIENYPYQLFGYGWLSSVKLNKLAWETARLLEDKGHLALPFPAFCETQQDSLPVAEAAISSLKSGKGASISHRHAAVVAGLGTFGWNNLLLTPEFGTGQRLVTILTTADLQPDRMLKEDVCTDCNHICAKVCPANAISREESITYELAGQKVTVAKLVKQKCSWFHDGMATETFGTVEMKMPEDLSWDDVRKARQQVDARSPQQFSRRIVTQTTGGHCGLCLVNCPKGQYRPR